MTTVGAGMIGVPTTEEDETTEIEAIPQETTEAAPEMTGVEVAQEMTEAAIVETEVTIVAKMKTTPEMTGIAENVATLIFHLEQNAIVAEHQRDVAAEVHQNSGLVTIEDLAIETKLHNLVQEIGNAASAKK